MNQTANVDRVYGPRFWATYLANFSLMIAVSLLFRYANFVAALGGSEEQLGMITGLGMIGGISARCFLGVAIDRYGAGRIWTLSMVLLIVCLLGHLAVRSLNPPYIHLLRILYTISLAGGFGASITFITLHAPAARMAEMIGMLGTSGFVGMAVGPSIGDWLLADTTPESLASKLFCWSAGAGLASFIFSCVATFGHRQPVSLGDHAVTNPASFWALIRKYHPGWTLLVGSAMGMGIGMPGTFLSAFAAAKQIESLTWFWTPYAVAAFVVRIATRQLADQWGTRPTILLGLICLATSMFAYVAVQSPISLAIPAVLGGIAHAFLFPAAVAEGNHAFPEQYRGMATTLMLMMFDIGLLIGQPVFGWSVEAVRAAGWDGYAASFSVLGTVFVLVATVYNKCKPI